MTCRLHRVGLHAVFLLSGLGGLGYQVIWARRLGLEWGQTLPAVLAVLTALLAGLAMGAWSFDRLPSWSRRLARTYAGLEVVIGCWGLATIGLVPAVGRLGGALLPIGAGPAEQAVVTFGWTWIVLLPAAAAMGATFPAMERLLSQVRASRRWVGSLYAAQTLGAALGVVLAGGYLVSQAGFAWALAVLAATNFLCAGAVLWLERCSGAGAGPVEDRPGAGSQDEARSFARVAGNGRSPGAWGVGRLHGTLLATGFLGIGFEVLLIRALRETLEDTVYTFVLLLAVYLVGTATGAAFEPALARRVGWRTRMNWLFAGLAVTGWGAAWMAGWSPVLYAACRGALASVPGGLWVAEATVAILVFLPLTILMGLAFATLAQEVRQQTGRLGSALAVNLVGGALAPWFAGMWLLQWLGLKGALTGLAAAYLVPGWRSGWRYQLAGGLLLAGIVLVPPMPDRPWSRVDDAEVIAWKEGVSETVTVSEAPDGHRTLRVGRYWNMGGTGAAVPQQLQAHLPLLLHPVPRSALFLGAGTAITLGATLDHPAVTAIGVEILPEIVAVTDLFGVANRRAGWSSRLRLVTADARQYVRQTTDRFDVIVGDLFHPGRDGAAGLYSREHFDRIRRRLEPGGLFCQWLPLYQLQGEALRCVIRTFLEVFPDARAWWLREDAELPVLGLIGEAGVRSYPADWLAVRGLEPVTGEALRSLGVRASVDLLGRWAADASRLRDWAGNAPVNRDGHPVLQSLAARQSILPFAPPWAPVAEWLADGPPSLDRLLADGTAAGERAVLERCLAARAAYWQGLLAEAQGRMEEAVAHWVRSAAIAPEFTTGYARCLTLAAHWAGSRPEAARALLDRLIEVRPDLPVAREFRARLLVEPPGSTGR